MRSANKAPPVKGGKRGLAAAVALILSAVFALEGGYVDHPNDPGGATNHGITERVARDAGFDGDMRELKRTCDYPIVLPEGIAETIEEAARVELELDTDGEEVCAEQILFEDYILAPGYLPLIQINPAVAEEVIDTAVNMGPARPSRFFQRAVNRQCGTRLAIDGAIGPITVRAWADCRMTLGPPVCRRMLDDLDRQQEAEYDRLVRVNPRLRVFRKGWQNKRIGNVGRARCGEAVS